MEQLNAKLYNKYAALKKRKLLDEGLETKREANVRELYEAMKAWASELECQNKKLVAQLTEKEQRHTETKIHLLDEQRKTKELECEVLRLQSLLAEKNDINDHRGTVSPDTTPEMITENVSPIPPAKTTPKSNSKAVNVGSSEEAIVPYSSFQEETRQLDCGGRHTGRGTDESSSTRMLHMLAESLMDMKISLKNDMEGFSFLVSHEASGYSFTLTWVEQPDGGEWSYQSSSLGTLERMATGWMKQDIRFSTTMCPVFCQRISRVLRQG